jgi:transcriptional regulator with XRE-family HTH domain
VAKRVGAVIGERVRHYRRLRRLTVKELAELCLPACPSLTTSVITNVERPDDGKRPRRPVTVEELLTLAWVLDVPPLDLIAPMGQEPEIEVLPDVVVATADAVRWLGGDYDVKADVDGGFHPTPYERAAAPVAMLRRHDAAARAAWEAAQEYWLERTPETDRTRREAFKQLRDVRSAMREGGVLPPTLPTALGVAMGETPRPDGEGATHG